MKAPILSQMEFEEKDFEYAAEMAKSLDYTQTVYTSTSALWGLYCLRDSATDRKRGGVVIKTKEMGLMFVQTSEDLGFAPWLGVAE